MALPPLCLLPQRPDLIGPASFAMPPAWKSFVVYVHEHTSPPPLSSPDSRSQQLHLHVPTARLPPVTTCMMSLLLSSSRLTSGARNGPGSERTRRRRRVVFQFQTGEPGNLCSSSIIHSPAPLHLPLAPCGCSTTIRDTVLVLDLVDLGLQRCGVGRCPDRVQPSRSMLQSELTEVLVDLQDSFSLGINYLDDGADSEPERELSIKQLEKECLCPFYTSRIGC
ncbi:hypothetical protein EYF80_015729 [Liparis tanakae]|uniref:Uncharacterized protein n=1 Tax=Liparis tanakae TaxID=230148 RepID=A0A4Z2I820_9TELE|nr:hypothetical protein EYF80_015729 [Liparis tanakae]